MWERGEDGAVSGVIYRCGVDLSTLIGVNVSLVREASEIPIDPNEASSPFRFPEEPLGGSTLKETLIFQVQLKALELQDLQRCSSSPLTQKPKRSSPG